MQALAWNPARRHRRPRSARPMVFQLSLWQSPAEGERMSADKHRLWLMYPTRMITRPVIWELGQKFKVIFNIRQASVNEEIGLVSLELEGEREQVKGAI